MSFWCSVILTFISLLVSLTYCCLQSSHVTRQKTFLVVQCPLSAHVYLYFVYVLAKTFDLFISAQYLQFAVTQSCTGFLYTNPFCPRVLVLNSAQTSD